jgi:hypothetical protein
VDADQGHEEVTALIEEVPPVDETPTVTQQPEKPLPAAQDTSRAIAVTSGFSNGTATATVQSYTQQQPPQPQKIPTYEQPLPNEYRESGAPRQDVAYQNLMNERSVRPSEMKDEG